MWKCYVCSDIKMKSDDWKPHQIFWMSIFWNRIFRMSWFLNFIAFFLHSFVNIDKGMTLKYKLYYLLLFLLILLENGKCFGVNWSTSDALLLNIMVSYWSFSKDGKRCLRSSAERGVAGSFRCRPFHPRMWSQSARPLIQESWQPGLRRFNDFEKQDFDVCYNILSYK